MTDQAKIAKMEGEIEWAKKAISKDKRRITSIDKELPTLAIILLLLFSSCSNFRFLKTSKAGIENYTYLENRKFGRTQPVKMENVKRYYFYRHASRKAPKI